MNFTVFWLEEAVDHLTEIWIEAHNRNAVTAAQAEIDRRLSVNPHHYAVHVAEGLYRIQVSPLQVLFEISEQPHEIKVVSVRQDTV